MSDRLEELNNTPSLSEIRNRRKEFVTSIFPDDTLPEDLQDCPCVSCENCSWRITAKKKRSAYCKVHFEVVYEGELDYGGKLSTDSDLIKRCIEFELADLM